MDSQTMLRLMSLFGGAPQESNTAQPMMQQPIMQPTPFTGAGMPTGQMSAPPRPDYDPYSRMKELYQPRTDISSAYTNSLMNMPERQPVGVPRGLAAIASSFLLGTHNPALGMQTGDQVAHGPYYQELGDWQNKTSALGKGAAEEDRYNANQRLLAEQTIGKELLDRKQEEAARAAGVKEDQGQQKINISKARADAYVFKTSHPDFKTISPKGGNVIFYNPKNPQETYDSGVPTGSATDQDKIEWNKDARLEEIGASGSEARKTKSTASGTPHMQVFQPLDENGKPNGPPVRINLNTGESEPLKIGGVIKAPPRPPANAAGTTEQIKTVTGPAPGAIASFFGAKPKETTTKTLTTKTPAGQSITVPAGKVHVMSPSGVPGFIPIGQLDAAIKQGYKKIQ